MKVMLERFFINFYLIALFLIGVGYISTIPVFEGFDETAHFSRAREIAYSSSHIFNAQSESLIDGYVENYQGPVPYQVGVPPPFALEHAYPKFFADLDLVKNYIKEYRHKSFDNTFQDGKEINWQHQHPPLYYLTMSFILSPVKNLSFVDQIFVMRFISYLFALVGIFFSYHALLAFNNNPNYLKKIKLGFLIYPIILPMFFLEFARIGNDSLCLLLTGLLSYFFVHWFKDKAKTSYALLSGFILGLGLWTKAFFVPISAAIILFSIFGLLKDKKQNYLKLKWFNLILMGLVAITIAACWYITTYIKFGNTGAGIQVNELKNNTHFFKDFFISHFSAINLFRGLIMPLVTYSWIGTWSVAHLPIILHVPVLMFLGWLGVTYFAQIKNKQIVSFEWLPLWLLLFFYGLLSVFVFINIATTGIGASGGWYLHILFPWMALIFGLALYQIYIVKNMKRLSMVLVIYSILFHVVAFWSLMTLYTGCSVKADNKMFLFPNHLFCIDQISLIVDRLNVLGYGSFGLTMFIVGAIIYGFILMHTLNRIDFKSKYKEIND